MMAYVWRIQDLYSILSSIKFPILCSLAAIGLYIADSDHRRSLSSIRHPVTNLVIAIVVLAVVSVPASLYPGRSFAFIKDDLGKNLLLMLVLAGSVRSIDDIRRYVAAMVIGGAIYAQFVYFNVRVGMSGRLGNLVYYDANDLGMLLVCTLPLALFFVVRGQRALTRVASLCTIGLYILVIVKSGSRGAFLGLIGVSIYLLLGFRSIPARTRVKAFVGGFLLLSVLGNEAYWGMMRTLLHPEEDYNWSGNADSGRMDVWKRGMGYMLARPLTGVGVRAFSVAEGTISPLAERQQYGVGLKWSAAHNSFVQIGAELGVFGLATLILLLVYSFRVAHGVDPGGRRGRVPDHVVLGHALAGTVVAYAVAGFFLSQAYAAYMFVIYGLVVGLAKAVPGGASRRGGMSGRGRTPRRGVALPVPTP